VLPPFLTYFLCTTAELESLSLSDHVTLILCV
jgi:hypothetical protein